MTNPRTNRPPQTDLFPFVQFAAIPGSDEWFSAVVKITPALAKTLLERNYQNNRSLKKQTIGKYATIMKSENWLTSPEGIVFDHNDELIDGQHRLEGIVRSDCTQNILVILGVDNSVYEVLNRGAGRTPADALRIPKKVAEVARVMAMIQTGDTMVTQAGITDTSIKEMANIVHGTHDQLMEECPTARKIFSSAAVRTAACVRILTGENPNYVLSTYKNMVLLRFSELSPISQKFASIMIAKGERLSFNGGSPGQIDLMLRAWDVFNFKKRDQTRIQISKRENRMEEIRSTIRTAKLMFGG